MDEPKFIEIHYIKQVRVPTLNQYLVRRAVKEAGAKTREMKGIAVNPKTGHLMPRSASSVAEEVKGLDAETLMGIHPDWVEEYQKAHHPEGEP